MKGTVSKLRIKRWKQISLIHYVWVWEVAIEDVQKTGEVGGDVAVDVGPRVLGGDVPHWTGEHWIVETTKIELNTGLINSDSIQIEREDAGKLL